MVVPAHVRKRNYRVFEGSIQQQFMGMRKKVQMYGGGFGNGKTAAAICLKAIPIARDYPGANILIARETFPKLNDTIRAEFLKWCPKQWIKSFPMSANGTNTCTLKNGTKINFRYISQQGKSSGEGSTSNLLSATYDLVIVDQIEDPGIVHKDFTDLMGRLRGSAEYIGNDPTMPRTGPRWLIVMSNPTRNWVYKKLVKPYHDYIERGHVSPDLIVLKDDEGKPVKDADGKIIPLIEICEGSTYANKENLPHDFIQGLESTYTGVMRERFLMGLWGAFEGLVYPDFDELLHEVNSNLMQQYLDKLREFGYQVKWIAGYDYGLAVQSCFLLAFVDPWMNVCVIDGLYSAETTIAKQRKKIMDMCRKYGVQLDIGYNRLYPKADPSIFRRGPGGSKIVGRSVADMFEEPDTINGEKLTPIAMERGNNEIVNGVTKVTQFLQPHEMHRNPFTGNYGAPHFYYSDELQFIANEASDYIWRPAPESSLNTREDKPRDGNDHAMDTIKYMLSELPEPSVMPHPNVVGIHPSQLWHEVAA